MVTKQFDFKTFRENVKEDLSESRFAVNSLENGAWHRLHSSDATYQLDDEDELNEVALARWLEAAHLKIEFAYDYLGLTNSLKKLSDELIQYEGKFETLKYYQAVDVFYSPIYDILDKHLNAITSQLSRTDKTNDAFLDVSRQLLLNQIINGTPKLLADLKIIPQNENVIRNAAFNVLVQVFPDTLREESISKVTKTFKPDIGIRSLKTAIEYKFADTKEEVKKAIAGVFEDISGYGGSEDWKTFYAVIYMTDNFFTKEQIKAEFEIAKVPSNWKLVLLHGKGSRKKKVKS